MSRTNNQKLVMRSNSYFKYLIFVLMLVQIVDSYATVLPGAIPSLIADEFLSNFSEKVQDFYIALGTGITTIGMYFLFFSQYLSDKIGRKKTLAISVFGMAGSMLGMFFSSNYIMYISFVFILNLFFSSDIWLIYVNEEVKPNKRAIYSNLILAVGLLGPIVMVISRFIFVTETNALWRGMTIFPMLLGFPLSFIVFFKLKETSKYKLMRDTGEVEPRSFKQDLVSIFKTENRKPYTFILIIVFIRGVSSMYMLLFEKYISNVGTLNQDEISSIFLLTAFTILIAYGINGFLADRIGRKPLLYLWSYLSPLTVLLWVLGALLPNHAFTFVMIGYSLSHISYWGAIGMIRLITIELLPTDRRGTGIGFRSLIGSIGGTLGLVLSSFVILFIGMGPTFIIFCIGHFLVIPITAIFLKETRGVELAEIK